MPAGAGGDFVTIDARELSALRKHLAAASDKTAGRNLLRRVREAGKVTRDAIAAEASFSSRIPGSLRVRATYAARGAVVRVEAQRKKAPHAAAINNRGRPGWFRHPVYGRPDRTRKEWTWVKQQGVPFMDRGAAKSRALAVWRIARVYDDVAREAGFK